MRNCAQHLSFSKANRKYPKKGLTVLKYSFLDENMLMTRTHVLSILLYCNCTKLQRKMKESLRNGNWKQIEYNKRKIHYWMKYLYECITIYGDIMENNQIFYHGIDTILSIPTMQNAITIPFSTTSLREIAVKFSNMKQTTIGMVFTIKSTSY